MNITTGTDEHNHPTVTARSAVAEGRVHLLPDGSIVLDGAFRSPMPSAQIGLLVAALDAMRAIAPSVRELPADATFTARIVTDDSVEPEDAPRQLADVVITADGYDPTPVASFALSTNPFDLCVGDHVEALAKQGWRPDGEGELDEDEYLILPVARI
ncbi:hypothetical protein [Nocardia salmonicida]|uniref:hypothetical protein n=1 Tax=Nocardia salmonicida TaxID=53431 RepID=UPI0007A4C153|nr:hypothetical protein [Nocardia salmonicida]